jgi:copper chaperone
VYSKVFIGGFLSLFIFATANVPPLVGIALSSRGSRLLDRLLFLRKWAPDIDGFVLSLVGAYGNFFGMSK